MIYLTNYLTGDCLSRQIIFIVLVNLDLSHSCSVLLTFNTESLSCDMEDLKDLVEVTIFWPGEEEDEVVVRLAGEFNNWQPEPMEREKVRGGGG